MPEVVPSLSLSSETLPRVPSPLPEIFVATPRLASRVSRDLKEGHLRKLAPSLYTTNVTEAPESLVRRQLWQVASLVFPGAVHPIYPVYRRPQVIQKIIVIIYYSPLHCSRS